MFKKQNFGHWNFGFVSDLGFRISDLIVDAFFPPTCAGCAAEGSWFCRSCTNGLTLRHLCFACRRPSPSGRFCFQCRGGAPCAGIVAVASYADVRVRSAIHALKFDGARVLAPLLAAALSRGIQESDAYDPRAVLVPIPTSPHRTRVRGYNQAALLATHVGAALQLPVVEALARQGWALSQTSLTHETRAENIRNAFHVMQAQSITGRHVLLIDDVATTGATLVEATRVCMAAGAATVWGCVVAGG